MRNFCILCLIFAVPFNLFAQRNFHRFSIGGGVGLTQSLGDVKGSDASKLFSATADYYLSPFLHGGFEFQAGMLSGLNASDNRYFNNNFKAILGTVKLHLGQFMRKDEIQPGIVEKSLRGVFIGSGAGIIKNNQTQIYRQPGNPSTKGLNNNKEVFIPFSAGIDNSGFHKRLVAGLRYQYNYALGDQVDGYSHAGSRNDIFSSVMINLKYRFGPEGIW